jgi:hypothetical protein
MRVTDDELNRAIDTVARGMTSAEPPSSLRASVMARVEGNSRGRGGALPRWAWAAAAGTAVVVVAVGSWLAQPTHQPEPEGSFVTVSAPAGPPPAVSVGAPPIVVAAAAPAIVRTPAVSRPRKQVPRPAHGLAWEAGPEPLAEPAPIAIDALGPDSLEIPEIHIAPIADIEPITIPAAGPGLPEPQRRDSR